MNDTINPPLLVILAAVLGVLGLFGFLGSTSKSETKVLIPAFGIMYVLYEISLLFSYMFYFTESEAYSLASFERYCGTIMMSFFLVVIYFIVRLSRIKTADIPPRLSKFTPFFVQKFILTTIVVVMLTLIPESRMVTLFPATEPFADASKMTKLSLHIFQTIKADGKNEPEKANIILLFSENKTSYSVFNYYMLPAKPQNYSYLNITANEENFEKLFVKPSDYIDFLLKNNIEYVYTMNVTDENRAEYSSIFTEPIQGEILYKLENGKLRPLKVIT
jgi:hypothetical protein